MTEVEGGGRQRGFITGGQADTSRDRSAPDQLVAYYPKRTVAATRHRVPQMCEFPDGFPQEPRVSPHSFLTVRRLCFTFSHFRICRYCRFSQNNLHLSSPNSVYENPIGPRTMDMSPSPSTSCRRCRLMSQACPFSVE